MIEYRCLIDNQTFTTSGAEQHKEKYPTHLIVTQNKAERIRKALGMKQKRLTA